MNKVFSTYSFTITLILICIMLFVHLMYGNSQTTKFHFIIQEYYVREYLPIWLQKDTDKEIKNYSGNYATWYKNGVISSNMEFKNGKINGKFTVFYTNGLKKAEFENENGVKNGLFVLWDKNGNRIANGTFKNGLKHGTFYYWYSSGSKKSEVNFKNNNRNGIYTEWDVNGKKIVEQDWKDGEMIKELLSPTN